MDGLKKPKKMTSEEDFNEYLVDGIEITTRNMITLEYTLKTLEGLHRGQHHQYFGVKSGEQFERFFDKVTERLLGKAHSIISLAELVVEVIDEDLVFTDVDDGERHEEAVH